MVEEREKTKSREERMNEQIQESIDDDEEGETGSC